MPVVAMLSSKFKIAIPEAVREKQSLQTGRQFQDHFAKTA